MKKLILLLIVLILSPLFSQDKPMSEKTHHARFGFKNPYPGFEERGVKDMLKWVVWDRFINNERSSESDSVVFEMAENNPLWLQENSTEFTITWVGHSSLLIQMEGLNILTDPVWSDRVPM